MGTVLPSILCTTHVLFLCRARRISADQIWQNDEAQNHQAGRSVCLRASSIILCFIILPFRFSLRWVAGIPRCDLRVLCVSKGRAFHFGCGGTK